MTVRLGFTEDVELYFMLLHSVAVNGRVIVPPELADEAERVLANPPTAEEIRLAKEWKSRPPRRPTEKVVVRDYRVVYGGR